MFVVKYDNTVEAKRVIFGPLDEGLRVIRAGLTPEDRVIVDGLQRARVERQSDPHTGEPSPPVKAINIRWLSINRPILAMVLSIVL